MKGVYVVEEVCCGLTWATGGFVDVSKKAGGLSGQVLFLPRDGVSVMIGRWGGVGCGRGEGMWLVCMVNVEKKGWRRALGGGIDRNEKEPLSSRLHWLSGETTSIINAALGGTHQQVTMVKVCMVTLKGSSRCPKRHA